MCLFGFMMSLFLRVPLQIPCAPGGLEIKLPHQAKYGLSERGPRSIEWLHLFKAHP